VLDKNDCIVIDSVELQGKTYAFMPEIELFFWVEDSNVKEKLPLLVIDQPRLGLSAFARTKKKLLHEAIEQIKFLIEEYVLADNKNFSPGALQLRKNWLKIIKH
jgi:hypothetical protein